MTRTYVNYVGGSQRAGRPRKDIFVDEVVVERLLDGVRVVANTAEIDEAIRRVPHLSGRQAARLIGCSAKTVWLHRAKAAS